MTSLMIIVNYLDGATLSGYAQDPAKPSQGDTSIPVTQGELPLQGAKWVQVIDEDDELPVGGMWWNAFIQFIDGTAGLFFLSEDDHVEGDPLIPEGWVELVDADGHKVWVEEDAVSSATANGPYWRQ